LKKNNFSLDIFQESRFCIHPELNQTLYFVNISSFVHLNRKIDGSATTISFKSQFFGLK